MHASTAPVNRQPFLRVILSASGVSMASQAVALLRQILIVSSFGFSRELDFYATLYALMSISVLSLASVLDSNYIGLLNERKSTNGDAAINGEFFAYVRASLLLSLMIVAALCIVFPVLSLPFTAGFTSSERTALSGVALYFLPWALLVLPFAAMGACLKSVWSYRQFFTAELIVTVVSTVAIYLRHVDVSDIALAYAYGYAIAILYLGWHLYRLSSESQGSKFPWQQFLHRFTRHFCSNQIGTLYAMAERFWFSYLPSGSIAALAVVQQLTMNLTSLLSFRDAYVVPLAEAAGRPQKISRLLCGLFLLSASAGIFVAMAAKPISTVLFHYGKTGSADIALLATLLSISMVGVVMGAVGTPIWRLLQVNAQYRPLVWVYMINTVLTLLLGQIFVGWMQLGAVGMAFVGSINATMACGLALSYAKTFGASLTWAQIALLMQSVTFFVAAGISMHLATTSDDISAVSQLILYAAIYGTLLTAYFFIFRHRLLPLLKGVGHWGAT